MGKGGKSMQLSVGLKQFLLHPFEAILVEKNCCPLSLIDGSNCVPYFTLLSV